MLAAARRYAADGWRVFPVFWIEDGVCACSLGDECGSPGKHPLTLRGVNGASDDLDLIAAWWDRYPRANIGVAAGASGLAVLDIDPAHGGLGSLIRLALTLGESGERLPGTLTAMTGGGGFHLVYRAPEGGVKNLVNAFGAELPGLDTRGRGGYVVVAPSLGRSGRPYEWICGDDPATWPDALTELMRL